MCIRDRVGTAANHVVIARTFVDRVVISNPGAKVRPAVIVAETKSNAEARARAIDWRFGRQQQGGVTSRRDRRRGQGMRLTVGRHNKAFALHDCYGLLPW